MINTNLTRADFLILPRVSKEQREAYERADLRDAKQMDNLVQLNTGSYMMPEVYFSHIPDLE